MKRIIVLGGVGHFGRTTLAELRRLGVPCVTASRSRRAEFQIDANDRFSIARIVRRQDIVLDTAGPFCERSTALVESAIEIGFDVVDINDDLRYAEAIVALGPQIRAADIRVLSSASTVSAVAAAVLHYSGMSAPTRMDAFLAPASRHTANPGAARSLIRSVGRPVQILMEGQLIEHTGWTEPKLFQMPPPLGVIVGRLFESADAIWLPHIWPSLRKVAMYVDTNTWGMNELLRLAARFRPIRRSLEQRARLGTSVARLLGSNVGGIGYEIEDGSGHVRHFSIVGAENSFVTAVAPAVLAAHALAEDRFVSRGLVLPNLHVEPATLFAFLQSRGIQVL